MPRIPDIPGDPIDDIEHIAFLKEQVARLCGLDHYRYDLVFIIFLGVLMHFLPFSLCTL